MFKRFWMSGALILILAAPAFGQGLYIGPQLGYQKARDADQGLPMLGAMARLKVVPALGIEGSINYRTEHFFDGAVTVRGWPVMLTGLLYPVPYLHGAMGFGWYNTTFEFESPLLEDHTEQKVGWHFGAGAELPLGRARLTGDIGYVFLDYDFGAVPGIEDSNADFYVIMAGLLIPIP